jgi:diguanylate cyclase (GGDEF)-like protein
MNAQTHHNPAEMMTAREALRIITELQAEVMALREQVEELGSYREMAYRDALTGLRNRRSFEERLAEETSRASRTRQYAFSVMVCDVNGLKTINDTLGHQAGDRAISEVAAFLESTLRDYDVCCRLGGDEFAVIMPGVAQPELAAIVGRIREAAQAAREHGSLSVEFAVGAATYSEALSHPAALIAAADVAMYADKSRAKRGGQFAVHEQAITAVRAAQPMITLPVSDLRESARPASGPRTPRKARRAATRASKPTVHEHGAAFAQMRADAGPDQASGGRLSDRWVPRKRGGFAEGIISCLPLTRLS